MSFLIGLFIILLIVLILATLHYAVWFLWSITDNLFSGIINLLITLMVLVGDIILVMVIYNELH